MLRCLDKFCRASGQKISLPKSRIYFSRNVSSEKQISICSDLGIEATTDLGLYLGMPTMTSRVTRETFGYLCEKIDRRLEGWKTKYLSLAGRVTLAKSTITTMASYAMQTAKIPRIICDDIDKRTRRFIWGGTEDHRRVHLLSWEQLQKPRDQGGLGVRSARQANSAFLTKLGWRVLTEPNSLWSRVLRAKYCKGRCDIDMFESKQNMSNVWRGITENTKHLCDGAQVAVGNGCKTLFWDHRWVSKKPLREYALHSIPDALNGATVEEMWNKETYSWKWSCLADLLPPNIIKEIDAYELKDDPNMGDLCYWGGSTNGKFSIKSAMQLIRRDDIEPIDKKWEAVWKVRVQQRIKMFVWLAMHDRVMGNTNRVKRQLTLDPRCTHCGAQEETTLHILRGCTRAKEVWRCVGGPTRTPTFWSGGLEHWLYNNLTYKAQNNQQSEIWPTYFAITLWWIWNWRNYVVFGRSSDIPIDVGRFLHTRFEETWRILGDDIMGSTNTHQHRQEILVSWEFPPHSWFALNTDGLTGRPWVALDRLVGEG